VEISPEVEAWKGRQSSMSHLTLDVPDAIGPEQLDQLRAAAGPGPVLILTHDNPDPDALAAGKALKTLFESAWGIAGRLTYSGLVARAENRAMLTRLTPEWEHSDVLTDLDRFSAVALVDTQPGAGNNRLPDAALPHIVIDHHHPIRDKIGKIKYADVRPEVGATSTMAFQYLELAGIRPGPALATAMFYGLKTDTRGLARGASTIDEVAYVKLLALLDQRELIHVEQAGLPAEYFRAFSRGLHATRLVGEAVLAQLGLMDRPDFAAEMADLLIRLEGARAALCVGQHGDTLHLSLRTRPLTDGAGHMIQHIILAPGKAGGHRSMAGGQVPLAGRSADEVMAEIERRFLTILGETGESVPLLNE
jgi:nanoRNase/pAp phosphatase (c-di-AMP/oligoRNAs hydrolase)